MANARHDKEEFDVVVSGAGPGGLAAALEAVYAGKRVAILSDRDIELETEDSVEAGMAFSRGQPIHLDASVRYRLLNLFPRDFLENPKKEDQEFLHLLQTDITIGIRHVERFLYRRLQEANATNPDNPKVAFFNQKEIKLLDMTKGEIWINDASAKKETKPRQCLGFKTIIAADGAKHHAVNKLNEKYHNQRDYPIQYHKVAGPDHPYHAAFALNVKRKDGQPITVNRQFVEVSTPNYSRGKKFLLSGISFNKKKSDPNTVKCVFGGEIPELLNKAFEQYALASSGFNTVSHVLGHEMAENLKKHAIKTSKETLQEYIKHYAGDIIAKELGIALEDLEITFRASRPEKIEQAKKSPIHEKYQASKNKLNFTRFSNKAERASKAYYEENGRALLVQGDAYATPNYQYGHGANDALKHAFFIGEVLRGRATNEQYDDACHRLSEETRGTMKTLNRLNWLFQLGDRALLYFANKKPSQLIPLFQGIKNPAIVGALRPLNDYLANAYFASVTERSAIALRQKILDSDQLPATVKGILDQELQRVNKKWFSLGDYKSVLQEACEIAAKRLPQAPMKKSVVVRGSTWGDLRRSTITENRMSCANAPQRKATLPWPDSEPGKQQSVTQQHSRLFDSQSGRAAPEEHGSRRENRTGAIYKQKPKQ